MDNKGLSVSKIINSRIPAFSTFNKKLRKKKKEKEQNKTKNKALVVVKLKEYSVILTT